MIRNLAGKSREQIEKLLEQHSHAELVGIICAQAGLEKLYKPSQVAEIAGMSKRTVLADIHAGLFGDYFKRTENQLLVPASGVHTWLNAFRVKPIAAHKKKPQNGLASKNVGQKGRMVGDRAKGDFGGGSDVESDDYGSATIGDHRGATDLVTEPGEFEEQKPLLEEGGRGSVSREGVGQSQNGKTGRNFMGNGGSDA